MTPQPNEPTAEAEAALHAFSQLKRSQVAALQSELQDERDLNKKMGNALDERNNELAALRAENERIHAESAGLRAQLDKRVNDFLSERACCDGHECGCMGLSRLDQMVAEEAGTAITQLRAENERLSSSLTKALQAPEVILTKSEAVALHIYALDNDDDNDTEYRLLRLPAWHDKESGEEQPPGLYLGYEEYPEDGLVGPISDTYSSTIEKQLTQLRARLSTAVDALELAEETAGDAPELNMANYSENDVSILNDFMIAVHKILKDTLAQLRPLLAGQPPTDPILSETPDQREQRRVDGVAWLDSLGTKQPPAAEVKTEEAWLAKTPYERLADLVGAAEAKRILGTSAQAEKA